LDILILPEKQTDDLEEALKFYDTSRQRIQKFLQSYEKQEVTESIPSWLAFVAQKEFASCQEQLTPLPKYLELSTTQSNCS